ncbi:MAG: 50S ribosomal protein L22 [Planctomycetaceae bacterium]|nr:MAG: 50S ribosomal protein L22 [Planctomycetaceae bacterium]
MAYRAVYRFARIAPTKVRHIVNLIRGRQVDESFAILRTLPHRGARMVEKVLRSARANAEDKGERHPEALIVSKATVDGGPMFKRIQPHARGVGFLIRKRFSHITIEVSPPVEAANPQEEAD